MVVKLMSLEGIYFVQGVNGGPIKIGVTRNVVQRLKGIQTGSPVRLKIVAFLPDAPRALEGDIHERYDEFRLEGEWFAENDRLAEVIKEARQRYPLEEHLPSGYLRIA